MRVLETRETAGVKRRRYELDDGRRLTTIELPSSVVRGLGWKKVKELVDAHRRGEETRARQARIQARLAEGWKPAAIAHEEGVTEARVRQVRDKMRSQ